MKMHEVSSERLADLALAELDNADDATADADLADAAVWSIYHVLRAQVYATLAQAAAGASGP